MSAKERASLKTAFKVCSLKCILPAATDLHSGLPPKDLSLLKTGPDLASRATPERWEKSRGGLTCAEEDCLGLNFTLALLLLRRGLLACSAMAASSASIVSGAGFLLAGSCPAACFFTTSASSGDRAAV